ncbi:hypothetical protein HYQ46_010294 [Verticillium longisporum]|nr:hypothetical protein HYQ46_010294 [Verticillium longisporum]
MRCHEARIGRLNDAAEGFEIVDRLLHFLRKLRLRENLSIREEGKIACAVGVGIEGPFEHAHCDHITDKSFYFLIAAPLVASLMSWDTLEVEKRIAKSA